MYQLKALEKWGIHWNCGEYSNRDGMRKDELRCTHV